MAAFLDSKHRQKAVVVDGVISELSPVISVDDTRVKRAITDPGSDCQELQADLQTIYEWAGRVGLQFNANKFE